MPWPTEFISLDQFRELVLNYKWKRVMTSVHVHHTYKPNRNDFVRQGAKAISYTMYDFHTRIRGWSDFGQHITILPDGNIVLGRDWNRPPASARGYNGNSQAGPFMFEAVGDFRNGKEYPPTPEQYTTMIAVIAIIQEYFKLEPEAIIYHKEMAATECPGDIDKNQMIQDVKEYRGPSMIIDIEEIMEDIFDLFDNNDDPSDYMLKNVLSVGSEGDAVKKLQKRLNELFNSGLEVDGNFGDLTEAAVMSFQLTEGLVVDGVVGPKTWGELFNE